MARIVSIVLFAGALLLSACESTEPGSNPSGPSGSAASEPQASTSITTTTGAGPTTDLLVVDSDGNPLGGVKVGDAGSTDGAGRLTLETPTTRVEVTAEGHVGRFIGGWPAGDYRIVLEPIVVRGVVQTSSGDGLPGVLVSLGEAETATDDSGRFEFIAPAAATLRVDAPGWAEVEFGWLGRDTWIPIVVEPLTVRALHVTGRAVQDEDHWHRLLDLAAATEINSLVVDLKDESGLVFYPSLVSLAGQVEAVSAAYRLDEVVSASDEAGLYLIGRIVTFQDPIAARALPELAVWDASTGRPFQKNGQFFLDPTDPEARRYALDLASEACAAGFDEIQFDYVRYPDGFGDSAVFDRGSGPDVRPVMISNFLGEASALLNPFGCAVAADIFGFITSTTGDGGIGQQLEDLAPVVDVLSPMLYPSHYSEGWFGFDVPNDHPGPVVSRALDDGIRRLDSTAVLRPWIQDFYYNSSQVRAQIEAAEERGLGWMLWNARSLFTEGALLSDE